MTDLLLARLYRAARLLWRAGITTLIIALAAAVTLNGQGLLADRAAARPAPEAAPIATVALDQIEVQTGHEITRRFSGQVEARQQTDLAFERPGTIADVLVREGDRVQKGAPIALLDTAVLHAERRRLEAQRDAVMARLELARRTNDRQSELRERGFATDQRVDDTSLALAGLEAERASLDAALSIVDVNLAKSEILAPFDGWIAERSLDAGAFASPGAPVATLLQDATPRFRVAIDPALSDALLPGAEVTLTIEGQERQGRLAHLAPDLDPTTRARLAFFDIVGPAPAPRATGEVEVSQTIPTPGAWVRLTALRKGPRGTWTLMTVEDGTVQIEAAEVLHLDGSRAFIRGTFRDGVTFVPGGTHRVVPGQEVKDGKDIAWAR